MSKMSFQELSYQIENLYAIPLPATDAAINQHCEVIAKYIRANGWTEDEYWDKWLNENGANDVDEGDEHTFTELNNQLN
jgi:phage gp36-like protein